MNLCFDSCLFTVTDTKPHLPFFIQGILQRKIVPVYPHINDCTHKTHSSERRATINTTLKILMYILQTKLLNDTSTCT